MRRVGIRSEAVLLADKRLIRKCRDEVKEVRFRPMHKSGMISTNLFLVLFLMYVSLVQYSQ